MKHSYATTSITMKLQSKEFAITCTNNKTRHMSWYVCVLVTMLTARKNKSKMDLNAKQKRKLTNGVKINWLSQYSSRMLLIITLRMACINMNNGWTAFPSKKKYTLTLAIDGGIICLIGQTETQFWIWHHWKAPKK